VAPPEDLTSRGAAAASVAALAGAFACGDAADAALRILPIATDPDDDDGARWGDAVAALEAAAGRAWARARARATPASALLEVKDALLLLADAAEASGRPGDELRAAATAGAGPTAAALAADAAAVAAAACAPPPRGSHPAARRVRDAKDLALLEGLGLPLGARGGGGASARAPTPPSSFPFDAPFTDAAPALASALRDVVFGAAAFTAGLLPHADALRGARAARERAAARALAPLLAARLEGLDPASPGALQTALAVAADAAALAAAAGALDAATVAAVADGGPPRDPPAGAPSPAGAAAAAAPWDELRADAEAAARRLVAAAARAVAARAASLPWLPTAPPPRGAPAMHVVGLTGLLEQAAAAAAASLPPRRAGAFTAAAAAAVGDALLSVLATSVPSFNGHAVCRLHDEVEALASAAEAAGGPPAVAALAPVAQLCHALAAPGGGARLAAEAGGGGGAGGAPPAYGSLLAHPDAAAALARYAGGGPGGGASKKEVEGAVRALRGRGVGAARGG